MSTRVPLFPQQFENSSRIWYDVIHAVDAHIVHMERKGEINESCVRFWTAELASACNYLHRQKIIHRSVRGTSAELIWLIDVDKQTFSTFRDIKPDNILLDSHGHVHLTDFNVAIHYSERRLHTSVAGSMAYMAPEILARRWFLAIQPTLF